VKQLVFVYGTLMSTGSNPATDFVGAEVVGRGWTTGNLYDFGSYPGLVVENRYDDSVSPRVYGELILVDDDKMDRLDGYECYPHLYGRQKVFVTTNDAVEEAWAYTYNDTEQCTERNRLVTGSWMDREFL
jgi:gamma-glutamylcyclotransferase (GGCT)/AIG2-like uncharacterized protein YtfP